MAGLQTPLCRALGIEYPIFSVGFGISAVPELVAAVSVAGGCGVLGRGGVPAGELRQRIAAVRELTDRPFGVNLIIADFEDPASSDEDRAFVGRGIAAAVEARVPLVVLFWGPRRRSWRTRTVTASRSSCRSARYPRRRRPWPPGSTR